MDIIEKVYNALLSIEKKEASGATAARVGELLDIDRSNASRYLNRLWIDKRVDKLEGRPVLFRVPKESGQTPECCIASDNSLDGIIGAFGSLNTSIQQAKAAILYPPRGLHTLLLGETGVGKSMFAELMYNFAVESSMLQPKAPFVRFNCADYADNPQLIMAQVFGVKKGAYTGADRDREGLLKVAHKGILFLDEIHRLPPQGQEILFTFIDKGSFRTLGETEGHISSSVQIIAATTEDPQSHLLKTFSRRIPMIITLPSLKDRGLQERYKLMELFIREESRRVSQSIYVNRDSLISFLLYDCPGNIGQLRSDIQLSCAKAFLHYKSKIEDNIIITQSDLPRNVKKGLFSLQEHRKETNDILKGKGDLLRFFYKEESDIVFEIENNSEDFYDIIEKKLESFMSTGIDSNEVNQMLDTEIERHFQNCVVNFSEGKSKTEIARAVEPEIIDVSKEIVEFAAGRLKKEYDEGLHIALALHLQNCIQRIRNGGRIYHPKLNQVRINHPDEFLTAMETAKMIDNKFKVETPLDEIGYLAMILASNSNKYDREEEKRVGVLIIMHGNSTASSMAQATNSLAGFEHAKGLDMPLSLSTNTVYELAKEQVLKMDNERGVLLLVDMGSLVNFGDMIYEETGIMVKTIDMVSTSMAVEACIKAAAGRDLPEVYHFCMEVRKHGEYVTRQNKAVQKNIIISACFTGEGVAERLKGIIEENTAGMEDMEVVCMNTLDKQEFLNLVDYYRIKHKILAIVGTVDLNIAGIPFISAVEILGGSGAEQISAIIREEETYTRIKKSLREHLDKVNGESIVDDVRNAIAGIEAEMGKHLNTEARTGIVLHTCFMLDKIKGGEKFTEFGGLDIFIKQYGSEMANAKRVVAALENKYSVKISENELAYLCSMVISN